MSVDLAIWVLLPLFVLTTDLALCTIYHLLVRRYVDLRRMRTHCDAAVVPYAGSPYRGVLDATSKARLDLGLSMIQSGKVDFIICVGGRRKASTYTGSTMMKQWLVDQGVESCRVVADNRSYDTESNWASALEISRAHGWRKIVVVSGMYQVARFLRYAKGTRPESVCARILEAEDAVLWKLPQKSLKKIHRRLAVGAVRAFLPKTFYRALVERWRFGSVT